MISVKRAKEPIMDKDQVKTFSMSLEKSEVVMGFLTLTLIPDGPTG